MFLGMIHYCLIKFQTTPLVLRGKRVFEVDYLGVCGVKFLFSTTLVTNDNVKRFTKDNYSPNALGIRASAGSQTVSRS